MIRYDFWKYSMRSNYSLCDHFSKFSFSYVWAAKYIMTHFREFIHNQKNWVVCSRVYNTLLYTNNKIYEKNILCFCWDGMRLKLLQLLPKDHSSSSTNQAGNTIFVYVFIYIEPEIFLTEYIVKIFGCQVPCKGVIMVFFQKFNLKSFNLR